MNAFWWCMRTYDSRLKANHLCVFGNTPFNKPHSETCVNSIYISWCIEHFRYAGNQSLFFNFKALSLFPMLDIHLYTSAATLSASAKKHPFFVKIQDYCYWTTNEMALFQWVCWFSRYDSNIIDVSTKVWDRLTYRMNPILCKIDICNKLASGMCFSIYYFRREHLQLLKCKAWILYAIFVLVLFSWYASNVLMAANTSRTIRIVQLP